MKHEEVVALLKKYTSGDCNEHEKGLVESFYMNYEEGSLDDLTDEQIEILRSPRDFQFKHEIYTTWRSIWVAACLLIVAGIGFYFYKNYDATNPIANSQHDIAPGGNKAFLTLADGKRITLTNAKTGELAEQSGVKITKATDGQLIYTVSNLSENNKKVKDYNTIETPNGGQYQIKLPDGTKVWLNAASSLKFPSSFAGLVNRQVELLRGEAYFEVAKDKEHPFIVQTSKQDVKVLGTHFNITNYTDESSIKITLLEGSVSVNNGIILKPGEQAINEKNNITIRTVDIRAAVDWKNNDFVFKGNSFRSIMRKIARWYDVEIVYDSSAPEDIELWGMVSRKGNISTILKRIESTSKVHFKIEGRRIIVTE